MRQNLLYSSGLMLVLGFDGYPTFELWDISGNSWSSAALHRELSLVPSSDGPLTQIDIDTPGYITRTMSFPYWDRVFLDDVVSPSRLPSFHGSMSGIAGMLYVFVCFGHGLATVATVLIWLIYLCCVSVTANTLTPAL